MASNKVEGGKWSGAERKLRFLRDVHLGLGAIALVGAVVFPPLKILTAFAGYEGLNAAAHEGLRRAVKPGPDHRPQSA